MSYRVLWTVVGPADRVLDSGDLDEFGDETSASDAVNSLLRDFAQATSAISKSGLFGFRVAKDRTTYVSP